MGFYSRRLWLGSSRQRGALQAPRLRARLRAGFAVLLCIELVVGVAQLSFVTPARPSTCSSASTLQRKCGPESESESAPKIRFEDLQVGQTFEGVVTGRFKKDFLFVDIGAEKDGILPAGELQDTFPGKKLPFLRGDKVKVRVLEKKEGGKLQLTMRPGDLEKRGESNRAAYTLQTKHVSSFTGVEDWFDAEVDIFTTYGAFVIVQAPDGEPVGGLIRVSDFKEGFAEQGTVGDKIKVRVRDVDPSKMRIAFTMLD